MFLFCFVEYPLVLMNGAAKINLRRFDVLRYVTASPIEARSAIVFSHLRSGDSNKGQEGWGGYRHGSESTRSQNKMLQDVIDAVTTRDGGVCCVTGRADLPTSVIWVFPPSLAYMSYQERDGSKEGLYEACNGQALMANRQHAKDGRRAFHELSLVVHELYNFVCRVLVKRHISAATMRPGTYLPSRQPNVVRIPNVNLLAIPIVGLFEVTARELWYCTICASRPLIVPAPVRPFAKDSINIEDERAVVDFRAPNQPYVDAHGQSSNGMGPVNNHLAGQPKPGPDKHKSLNGLGLQTRAAEPNSITAATAEPTERSAKPVMIKNEYRVLGTYWAEACYEAVPRISQAVEPY
ncbi:hypothetical protein B0H13DRAFT_1897861 [Mycena leptocephala]|nr:hypothetical protein B0H13DRAFT_1897861 [Mycena leptocephala]